MFARARRFAGIDSGHVASVVVVLVAYLVTLVGYVIQRNSAGGPDFSLAAYLVAVVLGAAYLALLVWGLPWMRSLLGRQATAVYFALLVVLALAIEFLMAGSNGIWLISMPLVAMAAVELRPGPRWLIYLLVFLGMIAPLYVASGEWQVALFAGLTFSPAIIFVIVFVTLAQRAEIAQAKAEELAVQLADANTRLATYAVQAEELATTQERNRLAREIHDNLGHYLTVANVQIKAAQAVMSRDPARAQEALDHAARLTQEGLAAVRQSVGALRESPLGNSPLPDALATLAEETRAAGIVTEIAVAGPARPLDPRAELTLYRVAQEGLTNVRKHARASRVDVRLDYSDPEAITLIVADNGVGRHAGAGAATGFGLLGLEERARQLGGALLAEDVAGGGYRLSVRLPSVAAPTTAGARSASA